MAAVGKIPAVASSPPFTAVIISWQQGK